jgi:urease subunit gamma/beta
MNLSPTELDRLTIFSAAEMARRNKRLGIRLSHPEAVALITDEAMVMARQDIPYAQIRDRISRTLTSEDVMPGVGGMIPVILAELPMAEGTKLLAIFDPIAPAEVVAEGGESVVPGEIVVGEGEIELFTQPTLTISVVNRGDRDVQVRSQTHFFEVNRQLEFDRASTWGMKLAVPSGAGERFEPGIPKSVELLPIGGDRIVLGQAGLVNGSLDDPHIKERAFAKARERGYFLAAGGVE